MLQPICVWFCNLGKFPKSDLRSATCARKSATHYCVMLRWYRVLFHGNCIACALVRNQDSSHRRFAPRTVDFVSLCSHLVRSPFALRAQAHPCRKPTVSSLYRSPAGILSAERNARHVHTHMCDKDSSVCACACNAVDSHLELKSNGRLHSGFSHTSTRMHRYA